MARVTYELKGFAEMERALEALGKEVATKTAQKATRKAAVVMRDEIKEAAPHREGSSERSWTTKDGAVHHADYGHLRENIKAKKGKAKQAHNVTYIVTTGKAFWARFLEFGTRHMRPRPFFKTAMERSVKRALETLGTELGKAIERAGRKG